MNPHLLQNGAKSFAAGTAGFPRYRKNIKSDGPKDMHFASVILIFPSIPGDPSTRVHGCPYWMTVLIGKEQLVVLQLAVEMYCL